MARRISQSLRRQRRAERKGHQEIWCEPRGEAKLTGKTAKNQRGRTATQRSISRKGAKGVKKNRFSNPSSTRLGRSLASLLKSLQTAWLINRSCARRRGNWERVRKADRRQGDKDRETKTGRDRKRSVARQVGG